jgi:DNA repair exonuclease SbcCD ATPase subunit
MSTPIKRPEHTLRQAFEEIDRAGQSIADQQQALAEAQKRVDAAQALQEAAQVQLTNAQARYSVLAKSLELAAPDLEALQARIAERERELALIQDQLRIVEVQAETVEQARVALRELFHSVRDVAAEATVAMAAMRTSVEEIRGASQPALRTAVVRNMCDALERRHNDLLERRTAYEVALTELDTAIETLRMETPSDDFLQALVTRREWLELDLADAASELAAKQPGVDLDELRRANDDLEAAKFATEQAPKAVRRAQAGLQAATGALTQAQAQQQAAQSQLETLESQFVAGIEVSAPNAAGVVTARAQFTQDIPAGYTLHWQAGAASVVPETGDEVNIDTAQLPVGETLIEARLVRVPAVA